MAKKVTEEILDKGIKRKIVEDVDTEPEKLTAKERLAKMKQAEIDNAKNKVTANDLKAIKFDNNKTQGENGSVLSDLVPFSFKIVSGKLIPLQKGFLYTCMADEGEAVINMKNLKECKDSGVKKAALDKLKELEEYEKSLEE